MTFPGHSRKKEVRGDRSSEERHREGGEIPCPAMQSHPVVPKKSSAKPTKYKCNKEESRVFKATSDGVPAGIPDPMPPSQLLDHR